MLTGMLFEKLGVGTELLTQRLPFSLLYPMITKLADYVKTLPLGSSLKSLKLGARRFHLWTSVLSSVK